MCRFAAASPKVALDRFWFPRVLLLVQLDLSLLLLAKVAMASAAERFPSQREPLDVNKAQVEMSRSAVQQVFRCAAELVQQVLRAMFGSMEALLPLLQEARMLLVALQMLPAELHNVEVL